MKADLKDKTGKNNVEPINVHVGKRIRFCRKSRGVSGKSLCRTLGVTFLQMQKYESGMDRVTATRLFDLSRALDVPISFFFGDDVKSSDHKSDEAQVAA